MSLPLMLSGGTSVATAKWKANCSLHFFALSNDVVVGEAVDREKE